MPLFHVQDNDRPMWVVAPTFSHALEKWAHVIAKENGYEDAGIVLAENPPLGVNHVCDDNDLLP